MIQEFGLVVPQGPQGNDGPPGAGNDGENTGATSNHLVQNPGSNDAIYIKDLQAGSHLQIMVVIFKWLYPQRLK